MTQAFRRTRATSARAGEIELIQTRLAVLSELESTLERDNATLRAQRAQRAAILLHRFGGGPRQSKVGRASRRPSAVPLPTNVVYPGQTKSPLGF
jgi:hypothetical protein